MTNLTCENIKKIFSFILICILVFGFVNCKSNEKEVLITVINEIQSCEEQNVFYRIIEIETISENLENNRDSLVLFLFNDSLQSQVNYDMFYPRVDEKRLEFRLKGCFLNEKVSSNNSYGCPGSKKFRITEIMDVKDVTEEKGFHINNR